MGYRGVSSFKRLEESIQIAGVWIIGVVLIQGVSRAKVWVIGVCPDSRG